MFVFAPHGRPERSAELGTARSSAVVVAVERSRNRLSAKVAQGKARYVAQVLPSGGAREGGWEQPGADTTRPRIKKTLSKGLRVA